MALQEEETKNNLNENENENIDYDYEEEKSEKLSSVSDSFSHIEISGAKSSRLSEWSSSEESSWDKYGYTKVYGALKDLEQFNVKISIPEFVFIGFQSSGKTSAVSQAAKIPVGIMKNGTASRCPTRFKLVNNPKMYKPLITVNGNRCKNVSELTSKCLQEMDKLEQEDKFCKDIIEVRIEYTKVPELTFVDLPGLIRSDEEQYSAKKKKLNEITSYFLHQTNPDGSFRYIPILVREPYDKEHDTHEERNYINEICKQSRASWLDDTLFIVNKFDKQINRSPASSLIEYMRYCCNYGQTVLTIMNPTNDNCSNMKFEELTEFVQSIEHLEEAEWQKKIRRFKQRGDENLGDLLELKKKICGVRKMNEILAIKMKEIVTKILPTIEKQLDLDERNKQKEIARLIQQIDLCNPDKLKQQCIAFNNRFLQNMRDYYDGPLIRQLDGKYTKSFAKEMNDFHVEFGKNTDWKYAISAGKLLQLVSKANTHSKSDDTYGSPEQLGKHLKLELIGSASILRIINAWIAMISFMPFPIKTDQDIINFSGAFHSTQQPLLWTAIRNVVLTAVDDLSQGCIFLAELLRYRLHQDADIIFEYTLSTVFGFNTSPSSNKFKKSKAKKSTSQSANFSAQPLLQRTLKDYKKETDFIIDSFKDLAFVKPQNQARILSKSFCEDKINLGQLLNHLLKNKNIGTKYFDKVNKQKNSNNNQENKPDVIIINEGDEKLQMDDDDKQNLDDNDDDIAYDNDNYDILFYQQLHGVKMMHPIEFNSMKYDIALIRHLSYVFWTAIKQITIDDVTQKLTNNVMKHIAQHDDKLANAIQCGVDKQRLKALIDQLVDQTGIDVFELEQLINNKKTLPITKSLNDLTKDEIAKIYGVNREMLIKDKVKKVADLQKFREAKRNTLRQIQVLKNSQIEENE